MKILNKVINLTMTVIMFFTATSILQATDFTIDFNKIELNELKKEINSSIDRVELNKLEKEINSSIDAELLKATPKYEGIPSVKTIKERYKIAQKNYKNNLAIINEGKKESSFIEYKDCINKLKVKAQKRKAKDSRYDGFGSEKAKVQADFYTVLIEEMSLLEEHKREERPINVLYHGTATVNGLFWGAWTSIVAASAGAGAIVAGIGIGISELVYFLSSGPYFDSRVSSWDKYKIFTYDPFLVLSVFGWYGADDFKLFYNESKKHAQLLYDTVDIEYYVSLNPTVKNMKARLYIKTDDYANTYWHAQLRAKYIHNLAERLRAEAKL